jgi:hypothetical protein
MIYDINFSDAASKLSPPNKREPKLLSWLKALLAPLQSLRDNIFDTYKSDLYKRARRNGQKIVLCKVLDNYLSITSEPKVYISDITTNTGFVVFDSSVLSSKVYSDQIYSDAYVYSGYTYSAYDFVVNVPSAAYALATDKEKDEFNQIIKDYKLYGTRYYITTY